MSLKCFAILSNVPLVIWLSQKLQAATRWPVWTAGNSSAIVATRQLVDITISGNLDSCSNILCSILVILIQKLKRFFHSRDGNCVLFEVTNQRRRFGLYEELDDDDEDQVELEPELPWLYPCPICGRRNEKVSNSSYLASRAGQHPLMYIFALCYKRNIYVNRV